MATPLHIEIAIHYGCLAPEAGDYGTSEGRQGAPAVVEYAKELMDAGLLERRVGGHRQYDPGPAMKTWIDALCAVPLPTQKWVIE